MTNAASPPSPLRFGLPAVLVAAVFVCFYPVLTNEFVNWDDLHTLVSNPHYRGLSLTHLRWMFTTLHMGHYQPLSWVTHALVYLIWGMNPVGAHLVNLLLHAANAVLFYYLVLALLRCVAREAASPSDQPEWKRGLSPFLAAVVGALFFAIHPLRVEAVAWATERREVLSSFFLLLTLLGYLRMQAEKRTAGPRWRTWWLVSLGCYLLSLLSKATGLTLPVLLLILDWYPLRRFSSSEPALRPAAPAVLLEKLPYAALACAAAATALLGVTTSEAAIPLGTHSALQRVAQAAYGLGFYLGKTLLPLHLAALYPLGGPLDPTELRFVVSALSVLALTATAIVLRDRYPWALAAWAAYVVTVSPVLGIVQSGPQIAADRYTYLSCLPWAVLVAAGVQRAWDTSPAARFAVAATGGVALALLGAGTFAQTRVWHDSLALWNQVLAIYPDSTVAHANRAHARDAVDDRDGALADYDAAIRLNPANADALGGRGKVRYLTGNLSGSLADFNAALRLQPRNGIFYANRGNTRQSLGDAPGALADFTEALRLAPDAAEVYYNRGNLRQARGDFAAALADYDRALALNPQYVEAYTNRGNTRQTMGDLSGALADFTAAIGLKPNDANAYFNRANARKATGDLDGAIADYTDTIRYNPQFASAYNNRATTRNAKGDTDGALADLNEAVRLNPTYAKAFANRAVARRRRGDAAGALADFSRALELTPANDAGRAGLERNVAALREQLATGG